MSVLQTTIEHLSKSHRLDPVTDVRRVAGSRCLMASGEEPYFVSILSDQIADNLRREGHDISYPGMFYSPSRRTEWKLGFDLSIGDVSTTNRLRSMHKILYRTWCDAGWKWESKLDDDLHLLTLLARCSASDTLRPFLILHVCFCVHDYRRMGMLTEEGWQIPGVSSRLRTVIVDLRRLVDSSQSLQSINWRELLQRLDICMKKAEARAVLEDYPSVRIAVTKTSPEFEDEMDVEEYFAAASKADCFSIACGDDKKDHKECVIEYSDFMQHVRECV